MDRLEPAQLDACVDLGGGDRRVPQHHLDGPKVGTARQEMSGEAMSEGVRTDVGLDPGMECVILDKAPETGPRQGPSRPRDQEGRRRRPACDQRSPILLEIRGHRGPGAGGSGRSAPYPLCRCNVPRRRRGQGRRGEVRPPPTRDNRLRTGSRAAASRRPSRVERSGAASRRSTAAGPSTVGMRSQTKGAARIRATFSVSRPSKIKKR